jgi:hypothetical protein
MYYQSASNFVTHGANISNLKIEAVYPPDTLETTYKTTRCNNLNILLISCSSRIIGIPLARVRLIARKPPY